MTYFKLEDFISENCDKRLPSILNFAIREAYRLTDEHVEETEFLQTELGKFAVGYIRHALVDIVVRKELLKSGIDIDLSTVKMKNNGYKYVLAEMPKMQLTVHKIARPTEVPRFAKNRYNRSILNRNYDLFEPEPKVVYDENEANYVMLTYGGQKGNLEFIQFAAPEFGVKKWVDTMSIFNYPILLQPYTGKEKEEFKLEFNKAVQDLLNKGVVRDGESFSS